MAHQKRGMREEEEEEGWSESENPQSAYISRLCSPSVGLRD